MTHPKGIAVAAAAIALPAASFLTLQGPADALFSQYLGAAALIAMALSQIIATRARFVEPIFGPLDSAYVLHKWLGIIALIAILLHDNIGAEIKGLGAQTALSELGESLGEQSLNGLLILLAITFITFIPYHIWYWTHRAMGVCFVLGSLHYLMILKPFSNFDPLGLYVGTACALGIASYGYSLLPRKMRRGYHYRVASLQKTGDACAVSLTPEAQPMRYKAGQFAFFTAQQDRFSETHPFTISSAPEPEGSLRISVGALGDYTSKLGQNLRPETTIRVDGPYGRFTPDKGRKPQIWIAGGIGITPFLAALENLKTTGPTIDLFYTFRGADHAPHLAEIQELAKDHDRVTLHLWDTATGPRLSPQDIKAVAADTSPRYCYCGPASMRDALRAELGWRNFHSEAFEIRTGLPLPKGLTERLKRAFRRGKAPQIAR